jgi:hypothetical protein
MFSFPEMWLSRVILLVTTLTAAPWLEGIEELDTPILELGSGTASEQNAIHIPLENFEVDVLINNSTYPIPAQPFVDGEALVHLDKYQTKVTTLSDDQIMGSSYVKIDSATRAHTRGILSNKFMKAIHALAPAKDTIDTPIIETTGALAESGRKKLVYKDLVALKRKLDAIQTPKEGRRLVLCSDHMNDLLEDRSRFADLLRNMNEGTTAPKISGFEIYQYDANPYFYKNEADDDKWTKRPFGTLPIEGDQEASVCFVKLNVAKKTGATKQYFKPAADDPDNQTNRLNYRHYFVAMPFRMKYMGAIVSGGDAESLVPSISSISPETGESGDTITINGQNFTGATAVAFGATPATSFVVVSDTVITAVVPTLADDEYDVVVTTPNGASNAEVFTVEAE